MKGQRLVMGRGLKRCVCVCVCVLAGDEVQCVPALIHHVSSCNFHCCHTILYVLDEEQETCVINLSALVSLLTAPNTPRITHINTGATMVLVQVLG